MEFYVHFCILGMEQYFIDPSTGQPYPPEIIQAYLIQQGFIQPQPGYSEETLQQQIVNQQVNL